jgi:hypothetical protein
MLHFWQVGKLDPSMYEKSPSGDIFVRASVRKGVLPVILDELLAARKVHRHSRHILT